MGAEEGGELGLRIFEALPISADVKAALILNLNFRPYTLRFFSHYQM